MITKLYDEDIPSERVGLLKKIHGQRIVNLVRFSWWPGDESVKQCNISPEEVFSLTAGPLLMYFDSGLVVGASSNPSQNSVMIWTEKNEAGEISRYPVEEDDEYSPIYVDNQVFSNNNWTLLINNILTDIRIIKRKPQNAKYLELPNEVGVLFTMSNGMKFLLSHGLHNNSDDFSVLFENQIRSEIVQELSNLF